MNGGIGVYMDDGCGSKAQFALQGEEPVGFGRSSSYLIESTFSLSPRNNLNDDLEVKS